MEVFDWRNINIEELDNDDEVKARINKIHKEVVGGAKIDKLNSPGFEPTPAQSKSVSVMTGLGMTPAQISDILLIEESLLKVYYKRELAGASPYVNLAVAKKALEMALSGQHPDMTKFWLKTRAGWRETNNVELTGKDGGPIEVSGAKATLMAGL